MMLWKKTQVLWSTYYVLLRTSAFSTDISHRDTPTRLPPFLLGSVSVSWGVGGLLGWSCTAAELA